MWTKPWKFAEGFLIAGGLLVVGLLLQLTVGPVDWDAFRWPSSGIVLLLFLALIAVMFALRKKIYAFEWMMHLQAGVPALASALAMTLLMGLTAQTREGGIPWLSQMLSFWPFVLIWMWMLLIVGLATLAHLARFQVREIPFILNHLGVFLAISTAVLGGADVQQLQMTVYYDEPEWRAIDIDGNTVEPGLTIELHQFTVDYYEDMTPRRFASDISVHTGDGQSLRGTVEVNKPLKTGGWKIYQYNYDARRGSKSSYSTFLLVRDPWLPAVYTGIFMMLAGALCLLFWMAPKPPKKEEEEEVL